MYILNTINIIANAIAIICCVIVAIGAVINIKYIKESKVVDTSVAVSGWIVALILSVGMALASCIRIITLIIKG